MYQLYCLYYSFFFPSVFSLSFSIAPFKAAGAQPITSSYSIRAKLRHSLQCTNTHPLTPHPLTHSPLFSHSPLQPLQNLPRMIARLHLFEHFGNAALLVYHHRSAQHAVEEPAVQRFRPPGAVGFQHCFIGIGQQRERQPVFGFEPLVRRRAVGTHAEHLETLPTQQFVVVAEVAGFRCATGRIVFGIKKQNELFTPEIGEGYWLAVFVYTLEIGSRIARLKRYFWHRVVVFDE